jgi:hypothetical protein
MNTAEIITTIENAVENDEKLNAWCEENLGSRPYIMVGYDALKPPQRDVYPLIILFDVTPEHEEVRMATVTRKIGISSGVLNETVTKTDRKIRFEGMIQSEAFREQISKAVLRKFLGKITVKPLGTESVYPFFASGMEVTVKSPFNIGV